MSIEAFDLAFGTIPHVIPFAQSFADRKTLCWLDWEDWMITGQDGRLIIIMNEGIFRGSLAYILTRYFARIPDGKLKFNLTGIDSSKPNSVNHES